MDDCLGTLVGRLVVQCIWAGTTVAIGNQIANHQNFIIQRVLQLQHLFRLPKCLHTFSEDDHDIPEADIKMCASLLAMSSIGSVPIIAGRLFGAITWNKAILILGILNVPTFLILWIILAVSARRKGVHRRKREGLKVGLNDEMKAEHGMEGRQAEHTCAAGTVATKEEIAGQHQPLRWKSSDLMLIML